MPKDEKEWHKQITREILEQAWNQANFDGLDELISPEARFHIHKQTLPMSAADTRRVISAWHRAFPDFRFTLKALVAEDDLVAARLLLSGTHQGTWQGIAATDNHIRVTVMMFLRYEQGKLVEIWEDFDELGMRRQLGVDL